MAMAFQFIEFEAVKQIYFIGQRRKSGPWPECRSFSFSLRYFVHLPERRNNQSGCVITLNWGHFFVIKGYQVIDQELFFQIYDPYSFGEVYSDYTLKGKNRFYRSEDVAGSAFAWWNYAFVIAKKGQNLAGDAIRRAVDPATIIHAHSL
jgi:hypothetical protein